MSYTADYLNTIRGRIAAIAANDAVLALSGARRRPRGDWYFADLW